MPLRPQQGPCLRCWRLLGSHEPTGNAKGSHRGVAAVLPHSCRQLQPVLLPLLETVLASQVLQSKGCQGLGGCPAAACCKVCCCLGVQQFCQYLPRRRQAPPPCGQRGKPLQDQCSMLSSSLAEPMQHTEQWPCNATQCVSRASVAHRDTNLHAQALLLHLSIAAVLSFRHETLLRQATLEGSPLPTCASNSSGGRHRALPCSPAEAAALWRQLQPCLQCLPWSHHLPMQPTALPVGRSSGPDNGCQAGGPGRRVSRAGLDAARRAGSAGLGSLQGAQLDLEGLAQQVGVLGAAFCARGTAVGGGRPSRFLHNSEKMLRHVAARALDMRAISQMMEHTSAAMTVLLSGVWNPMVTRETAPVGVSSKHWAWGWQSCKCRD